MKDNTNNDTDDQAKKNVSELPLEPKQQQSDPNLTELKGFFSKEVPLEPNAKQQDKEK